MRRPAAHHPAEEDPQQRPADQRAADAPAAHPPRLPVGHGALRRLDLAVVWLPTLVHAVGALLAGGDVGLVAVGPGDADAGDRLAVLRVEGAEPLEQRLLLGLLDRPSVEARPSAPGAAQALLQEVAGGVDLGRRRVWKREDLRASP